MNHRFRKNEHLKSRKLIQGLFKSGKTIKAYPLLAVYHKSDDVNNVQVGFSVAKKKIRLAVNRNKVKRRMKEAYRLNRSSLGVNQNQGMLVMFVYLKSDLGTYEEIEKAMQKALASLIERNPES